MLGEPVDNDPDNLISLSLADHFLVHYYYYLLAKKGFRQRMATAFTFMAKKGLKYMTPETAEQMARDYEEAQVIANQFNSEMQQGRELSEETRRKIGEAKKGDNNPMRNPIYKAKMAESLKGNKCHLGCLHSEETKRKMAEAKKGRHWKLVDGIRVWYD